MIRRKQRSRRKWSLMILAFMVMSLFRGLYVDTTAARAEEEQSASIIKIVNVILKVNGEEVEEGSVLPDQEGSVEIFFEWEIDDDAEIIVGDFLEIRIPEGFFLANNLEGDLLTQVEPIGTYTLDRNTRILRLEITNPDAQELLDIRGTVQIRTEFQLERVPVTNPVEFVFRIGEEIEKTFLLTFAPGGNIPPVAKQGVTNRAVNPDEILWTVDVNQKLEAHEVLILEDIIGPGHSAIEGSFEVYALNVNLDGSKAIGALLDPQPQIEMIDGGNGFSIGFGETSKAYRILYRTRITDPNRLEFSNLAKIGEASSEAKVTITRGVLLDKEGVTDRAFNPNAVQWTVFANMGLRSLTNAKVEDVLPEGLVLNEDSVKVYRIALNDNGEKIPGSEVLVEEAVWTIEGSTFTVELGDIEGAFEIRYETDIADKTPGQAVIRNRATLTSEETTPFVVVEELVLNRGTLLEKAGRSSISYDEKFITWTVNINWAEEVLGSLQYIDTVGDGHQWIEGSMKLEKLTFDAQGAVTSAVEVDLTGKVDAEVAPATFRVNLGNVSEAYRLTYRTEITDVNRTSFTNSGVLRGVPGGNGGSGDGDGEVREWTFNGSASPTIQNSVSKANRNINYQEKTMDWRVTINPVKEPMLNLVIEDQFPNGGLRLREETLIVRRANIQLEEGVDYTFELRVVGDWTKGYVVKFLAPVQGAVYTIDYKTDFDRALREDQDLEGRAYRNTVTFSWNETTTGEQNRTRTATATLNLTAARNGAKSGVLRRTDRAIDWSVLVNHLSEPQENLMVSDVIVGNQQMLPDSLQLISYRLSPNDSMVRGEALDPSTYEVLVVGAGEFRIFFETLDTPVEIRYTTELLGQSQSLYENTAIAGGVSYTATVPFPDAENFVDKSGVQDGSEIRWSVRLNRSLSVIDHAVMTDTLGPNSGHAFVQDSFRVYQMPGKVLVDPDAYVLEITILDFSTQEQQAVLRFNDRITAEYLVEYRTEILVDEDRTPITNKVLFEGDGVEIENETSEQTIIVRVTEGGGTGSGRRGTIRILKTDGDTNIPLSGVVFELLNSQMTVIGVLPPTNEEGNVLIEQIGRGTYYLREKSGLEGYLPLGELVLIELDQPEIEVEVENYWPRGLELRKVVSGNTDLGLEGAEYVLRNQEGSVIATLITDEDGFASLENVLHFGAYTLQETKAPVGYVLDSSIINITVDTSTPVIQVLRENERIRGNIEILKLGEEMNPLSGARFELLDHDGNQVALSAATNAEGLTRFENVEFGIYVIREVHPPTGYLLGNGVRVVNINTHEQTLQYTFSNEQIRGNVEVEKLGEDDEVLEGAIFELVQDGMVVRTSDPTDAAGRARFLDVEYGHYVLREKEAPEGHLLSEQTFDVTIEEHEVTLHYVIRNERIRGNVTIEKLGEEGEPLAGAVFELVQNGEVLLVSAPTDAEGRTGFADVEYGVYILREQVAPEGHRLSEQTYDVVIEEHEETLRYAIENERIRGNVAIEKLGEEGEPLAGAVFELLQNGEVLLVSAPTDAEGRTGFADVEYGAYILREQVAPEGHRLSEQTYDVVIEEHEETLRYAIENERIRGNVTIEKLGEEGEPLAGAVFELLQNGEVLLVSAPTDAEGRTGFAGVEYGVYILREQDAPEGHRLSEQTYDVVIEEHEETLRYVVENERIRGHISILKVDESGEPLEGAEFLLKNNQGETMAEVTTNEDGTAYIGDLEYGVYSLEETAAPEGFRLLEEPIAIFVEEHDVVVEVTIGNEWIRNDITIEKVDGGGHPLAGAVFELLLHGVVIAESESTSEDGKVMFENIPYGHYVVREKTAPVGYLLSDETMEFMVLVHGETLSSTLVNERIMGSLRIVKVDEEGNLLAGAVFEVRDELGVVATVESNEEGIAYVTALPYGSYTIHEVQAPERYLLTEEVFAIQIEEHEVVVEIEVVNEEDPEFDEIGGELPSTGTGSSRWYQIVGFLVMVSGALLLTIGGKKRRLKQLR